jgi:hypothetical protein
MLCLAVAAAAGLISQTAFAHGTNTASESGGFALLVFPAAIIIFVLFHLFMRPK